MSLIDELKRRNVFKVAGAYLAIGWVVVQATATLTPAFHLPESALPLVTWIGVIGFPFVVAFSWIYELTPEGLKRESEVDRSQSITQLTSQRLDYIIIAMLGLAMLLFAADRFLPRDEPLPAASNPTQADAVSTPDGAQGAPVQEQQEPAAALAPDDKSIAVLPFADMSAEKDQQYMSDGMAEELLNLLAKAPDLKVIARTSSFAFKGKDVPIAEIAKQLNVAHVLEGSVRKAGNTVRITAQLIRTADSTHLWSETYDRPLDDIFAVQDEIANAIVQALQIRMMGGKLSRREGGTQNLEAYQLYLRSISANLENTRSSLDAAGGYLEQALKIDPTFGRASAALAQNFANKADNGFIEAKEGYERARQMAQHALQLSAENPTAHTVLQYVYLNFDWDWAAAEAEGRRARAIDPTDLEVLNTGGMLSSSLGRWDDAQKKLKEALARDPFSTYVHFNLGSAYYGAGRFADAERMFRRLMEIEPGFTWGGNYLGLTLLAQGKADEALAVVQHQTDERERLKLLPVFLHAVGRTTDAEEAQKAQIANWENTGAYYVAMTYAYRGDQDRAIEWLDRAYSQKDTFLSTILGEQLFKGMATDPRFKAFLRKMNLPDSPPG